MQYVTYCVPYHLPIESSLNVSCMDWEYNVYSMHSQFDIQE